MFDLLRQRAVPWLLLENVPFMWQLANGQAAWLRSDGDLGLLTPDRRQAQHTRSSTGLFLQIHPEPLGADPVDRLADRGVHGAQASCERPDQPQAARGVGAVERVFSTKPLFLVDSSDRVD
ncbi:MAG: hypothetical protein ACREIR_24215 [Geminicoccaceae bacterium]